MTNSELKFYINSGKYQIYQHTNGSISTNFYLISIPELNKTYMFKYNDNTKNNPELVFECDYANPINKFWYTLGTNWELIPGKIFDYDDDELVKLIKLVKTGKYTEDIIDLNAEDEEGDYIERTGETAEYTLSCKMDPENTETVGKIVWEVSESISPYFINNTVSRDSFSYTFEFDENKIKIESGIIDISGTVTAIPYDNDHIYTLGEESEWPVWIFKYYIEIESTDDDLEEPENPDEPVEPDDIPFSGLSKVTPKETVIVIDNDGKLETNENEVTCSVSIVPPNTTDNVTIKWTSENKTVSLKNISDDGLSATTNGFNCSDTYVHIVKAIPVVNEVEQPDKAITWTFEHYSTCIKCGHKAPSNAGWPLCPSCGKFQ